MPRKNQKRSPYFMFMKQRQDEIFDKKGIRLKIDEIRDLVSAEWNALSPAERKVYDSEARSTNEKISQNIGRLASDGTSIAELIAREEEQQQQKRLVEVSVREYVMGGTECESEAFRQRAINQVHYILAFNTLGRFEEMYIPCEVGLVEFSIKNGITKSYTKIIQYGSIPSGQQYSAMQHSDSTHKLFRNSKVQWEGDYNLIWKDIISFLTSYDEELPPIFTLFDQVEQTLGCLQWLSMKANEELYSDTFCIWSIAHYLYELRLGCGKTHVLSSIPMAIEYLQDTSFDYTIGSSCSFHEEDDSRHCALGYTMRNCYLIFSSVHEILNVVLTQKHIPKQTAVAGYLFKPAEQTRQDAPSVPRSIRENGDDWGRTRGYDTLEDFDDDDDIKLPSSSSSVASLGRGAIARKLPQSINDALPRDMARMNLGAFGHSAGIGIGRGRPVSKS